MPDKDDPFARLHKYERPKWRNRINWRLVGTFIPMGLAIIAAPISFVYGVIYHQWEPLTWQFGIIVIIFGGTISTVIVGAILGEI